MKKTFNLFALVFGMISITHLSVSASDSLKTSSPVKLVADADNAGLKLPTGFGGLKVADGLGKSRHIAVTAQGDIYVKMSGRIAEGKGILKLHDANGDGKADETTGMGNYGGTGIVIKNG